MEEIKGNSNNKVILKRVLKILYYSFLCIVIFVLFLLYGPYSGFRNWYVTTAMSTMTHQYLAKVFYSDKTISNILSMNQIIENTESINLDLISSDLISDKVEYKDEYDKEILEHDKNDIYKIIDIKEKGYSGYLVAIYDSSKIKLATSKKLGVDGEYLTDMASDNNAVVAINGGGFLDSNGLGNGGEAQGILIKDGVILQSTRFRGKGGGVIGFTNDNKLYLGNVSAEQAIRDNVRDAVEFGPFLIVNGVSSEVVGNGGYGIHPRSAIGQRKDGIVLFLVIDGRTVTSLGADMDDLIYIMERYGAYNAANLDGGNSSVIVVNNKIINHPINWDNLEKTRPIADGFVVVR